MKNFHLLCLLCLLLSSTISISQTHIWTGSAGDDSWLNSSNWNANSVPDSSSEVVIPEGFNVEISSGTAEAFSINLEGTSNLVIQNNFTFSNVLLISADATLIWKDGEISGGGTIENNGEIEIVQLDEKELVGMVLNNHHKTTITTEGGTIRLKESTVINNAPNAVFEIIGSSALTHNNDEPVFNNFGLVKKTFNGSSSGFTYMIFEMNNAGVIDIEEGETFLFLTPLGALNNSETGIIQGFGVYDVTSPFANAGVISPGGEEIGTLHVVNNFGASPQAIFEFDIAGTAMGEYDVISITGFPDLEGIIAVKLFYEPQFGDSFTIWTANDIDSCNFPDEVIAAFNGTSYLFEVQCNTTHITLEVVDATLGIVDTFEKAPVFYVHPNPVKVRTQFTFSSENFNTKDTDLVIYNYLGQEIVQAKLFEANTTFERGNLPSGIYFAQLKSESKIIATTKMVLE